MSLTKEQEELNNMQVERAREMFRGLDPEERKKVFEEGIKIASTFEDEQFIELLKEAMKDVVN